MEHALMCFLKKKGPTTTCTESAANKIFNYHPLDDMSSSGAQGRCGSIHASTEIMTVMLPSKAEQQNQRTK